MLIANSTSIGHTMLHDTSEIMQAIIGHLIHAISTLCDLDIQQLFPDGSDVSLYQHFPLFAVDEAWADAFDKYIGEAEISVGRPGR
jgi:hypothetical protein